MSTAEILAQTSPPSAPLPDEDAIGRRALRKVSLRLLPLIAIGYGIAYMDRINVSFAALQMNHALHFSASAYGLGAGLFFLSYGAFEIPSNLLLVRFGARRWLSRIMFTWGLLSIAMMFVRTPWQFYLARLALGAAEAGFFPGIIFYLTLWFPAAKRSLAISRFYIALPLSTVVMGALAGMLLNLNGRLGLAGWQWLFLMEGLPAILMSAIFFFCLPDSPLKATWLSEGERTAILRPLQSEAAEPVAVHNFRAVTKVLKEPKVWMLALYLFCAHSCNYGYSFVAPVVIQKVTNFSVTTVGLIVAFFGILGTVTMLFNGWHSDRYRERHIHILVPTLLMTVAFLCLGLWPVTSIVLPAFALAQIGACANQPPTWTLTTTLFRGKSCAVAIAAINSFAMTGGFVGPWWIGRAHDITGNYQLGLLTLVVPTLVASAIILVARRYSKAEIAHRQLAISEAS